MSRVLRGGRLESKKEDVAKFTSSIKDDARLISAVIDINKAHVVMLMEQNIIGPQAAAKILKALCSKLDLKMDSTSEDVHMAVEEAVLEKTGLDVGGNIHIAKSRNDQVSTAIRMELRKRLLNLMFSILQLQESFVEIAEKNVETVILGYTHLQPAQPVTFGHYLLSRFDAVSRDLQRLEAAYAKVNFCPMGAGALATTSFPIKRERVAELLGFDGLVENSIDAVSSRDFILESLAGLTTIAVTLSQLAEDIVVWSSIDFGIVELPDDYASTSSIMPQKKNLEIPELIRARTGYVISDFVAAATILKGLPSTYNLDLQEITPKLWDAADSVDRSLKVLSDLIPNLKVNQNVYERGAKSFVAATELANTLVRNYNVAFRAAHKIVGALVRTLIDSKQTFINATPELLQKVAKDATGLELRVKASDIADSIDLQKIVANQKTIGGPAPVIVKEALAARKLLMAQAKSDVSKLKGRLDLARKSLNSKAESISVDYSEIGRLKNSKRQVE